MPEAILNIIVTYLQMTSVPEDPLPDPPTGVDPEVVHISDPGIAMYRRLYRDVGEEWLWWERLTLSDSGLKDVLYATSTDFVVLYVGGEEAGFAELSFCDEGDCQIVYFGLTSGFIGRGFGRWFLGRVIRDAWERGPSRLWLHTCTLDHPRAMPLYESLGFIEYATERKTVPDPRATGLMGSDGG